MKSNKFLLLVFIAGLMLTLLGLIFIRVEITSEATGVIQFENESIVYASRSGQVSEIYFQPGQRVNKGDLILSLQNSDLDLRLLDLEKALIERRRELHKIQSENEQFAITGVMPSLQNIGSLIDRQRELSSIAELIEENNRKSLEQNLISRKEFYQERMDRIREEITLIKNQQLLQWKGEGLEDLIERENEREVAYLQQLVDIIEKQVNHLHQEKEKLLIKAPFDGIIVDFYFRYLSQIIEQGNRVVKIADDSSGYQVKAYIPEKNIDLIDTGMPVRMESMVFHSQLEGYLYGTIAKIINTRDITSPEDTANSYFETLVDIHEYPYPPVHGSRVHMDIIIGKGNLVSALLNRPGKARDKSNQQ